MYSHRHLIALACVSALASADLNPYQPYPTPTEPDFNPPQFEISWNGEELEPGFILLTPTNFNGTNATKESAPLVMTSWVDLVYQGPANDPSGPYQVSNLRYQSLNNTQHLTYWNGYVLQGINASIGFGNFTILDNNYRSLTVCPHLNLTVPSGTPHECDIDYNEQYLTPWGTLLVTAYNLTQVDLTSVNGSANGYVLDAQIHEIDLDTSESIWKWSALDHIALNASQLPLTGLAENASVAWDYVHIDSVSTYGDRKLLVSARHTWDVFAIEHSTKAVLWSFNGIYGGNWGSVPEESTFTWQYHTRVRQYGDDYIVFSNFGNHDHAGATGGDAKNTAPTVGREFRLSLPPSKDVSPLTLNTFNESSSLFSDSWGSFDYVPNQQNATTRFISYGQLPVLREYGVGPGYNVSDWKWNAVYGFDNEVASYRSQKGIWFGEPILPPKLVVLKNGTAFMSWNGATHVTAWKVYGNSTEDGVFGLIGMAKNQGFETAVDLSAGCYQVQPVLDSPSSTDSTLGMNSTKACSY